MLECIIIFVVRRKWTSRLSVAPEWPKSGVGSMPHIAKIGKCDEKLFTSTGPDWKGRGWCESAISANYTVGFLTTKNIRETKCELENRKIIWLHTKNQPQKKISKKYHRESHNSPTYMIVGQIIPIFGHILQFLPQNFDRKILGILLRSTTVQRVE